MPLSAAELKQLTKYDSPTIANVIELFEVRPRSAGFMDKRIRACFPGQSGGKAGQTGAFSDLVMRYVELNPVRGA